MLFYSFVRVVGLFFIFVMLSVVCIWLMVCLVFFRVMFFCEMNRLFWIIRVIVMQVIRIVSDVVISVIERVWKCSD